MFAMGRRFVIQFEYRGRTMTQASSDRHFTQSTQAKAPARIVPV